MVVGTINVDAAIKDVRFAVWDVFVKRKVWTLLLLDCTLFFSREKKPALKKRVARGREEVSRRAALQPSSNPPSPKTSPSLPTRGSFLFLAVTFAQYGLI